MFTDSYLCLQVLSFKRDYLLLLVNAVLFTYGVWRRQKELSKFRESPVCLVKGKVPTIQ